MASMAGRGGSETAPGRTAEAQRARILRAMVEVVAERGFAGATVGLVSARARVSRRTFEGLFSSREECLAAVFDLGLDRTVELAREAFARATSWQEGVRTALAALLVLLDAEPLLARVWLVESLAAGPWALEHRERNLQTLRDLIVSSWPVAENWSPPPLAAEGVLASVLGITHRHIAAGKHEPLIELLGPLMGLIASPYLPPHAVHREVELGAQLACKIRAGESRRSARQSSRGPARAVSRGPVRVSRRSWSAPSTRRRDASEREDPAGAEQSERASRMSVPVVPRRAERPGIQPEQPRDRSRGRCGTPVADLKAAGRSPERGSRRQRLGRRGQAQRVATDSSGP